MSSAISAARPVSLDTASGNCNSTSCPGRRWTFLGIPTRTGIAVSVCGLGVPAIFGAPPAGPTSSISVSKISGTRALVRTVIGIFHFAPSGESTRFETRVRWQQGADSLPIPWSGYSSDYAERDGIRFPRGMRAVWHEQGGDFEYVQGRIERIEFDVDEP